MKLLNLAIHLLNAQQIEQLNADIGDTVEIFEITTLDPKLAAELANTPDNADDCTDLAGEVHELLRKHQFTMVHLPGGSPAFMFALSTHDDIDFRISYVFSHSNRVSGEVVGADGTVTKVSKFKFQKFIYF